jgi:hypothetical protein
MLAGTLERLWELADRLAGEQPGREDLGYEVFEPIGLILERPPVHYNYPETPQNTTCFAHISGEGVHFSFLHVDGQERDESPIVMTVPDCETPNLIVGADLLEFLRLGCRAGYILLDGLADNLDETIDRIESAEDQFDQLEEPVQNLFDALCLEFGLCPWNGIETRLRELQSQYVGALARGEPGDQG